MDERLREAILFAAQRDGMTGSGKIRQILTQQMARTMESTDFRAHEMARAARQATMGGINDGGS